MDEAIAPLVREWLSKATHDLQAARILGRTPDGPLDVAIFHCQQAAEKVLKGWFTASDIAFEKTHDIRRLVLSAQDLEPEFARFATAAEILTPYASAYRYPGVTQDPMPSREEFVAALQHAQSIYDFVLDLLPVQARP